MCNEVFDRLHEDGRSAVLTGRHRQDSPPADGGRWPVTVVCIPPPSTRATLEHWMTQACALAGPGHFLTGRADASHVTVRALEAYRDAAHPAAAVSGKWASAIRVAAAATPPLQLRLTGITLTSGSVMAQLEPVDDAPWAFMERLRAMLGEHAWYEDQWDPRNIWYANILHFAAPIADPSGLVDWVDAHRRPVPEDVLLDSVSLVRYRYQSSAAGRLMAMEQWSTAPLTG
jgi:hypothetical protein